MDTRIWHIVRVTPNDEDRVSQSLRGDVPDAEVYFPICETRRFNRRLRVMTHRQSPIYPGYVFVRLAAGQHFNVKRRKGLFGFMRNSDNTLMAIRESEMHRLMALEMAIAQHGEELKRRSAQEQVSKVTAPATVSFRSFAEFVAGAKEQNIHLGAGTQTGAASLQTV